MTVTVTTLNVDMVVPTGIVELVAAPAAGKERIVSLVVANQNAIGGADATFDLSRYDGTTDIFAFARNSTVSPGKPVIAPRDIILKPGKSLRIRASAAATLHVCADVIEQTVS